MEESIKKIPWPVWAGVLVLAAGIVLWQRSKPATVAAPDGSLATSTGGGSPPVNTGTPSGGPGCPQYAIPSCTPPDFVIFEADSNGCPMPVCSSVLSHPPIPTPTGPTCSIAQTGKQYTVGVSGPLSTLRQIFNHWGEDVNCALQWNPTAPSLDYVLWSGFWVHG